METGSTSGDNDPGVFLLTGKSACMLWVNEVDCTSTVNTLKILKTKGNHCRYSK